ncbi:DMT family transporter [Agromyces sp. MMS24-JH15]|uniref:DMT family transporter n=1 Tax=Agromyces sp. MMS24-JH15 TaxID=3243765 RepID=UPI0037495933
MNLEHGPASRAIPVWAAVAIAVGAGVLTAIQSRINGQLAARAGDSTVAAAVSFGSGLVILLVVLAVWRPGRVGFAEVRRALARGDLRWWMLLGGLAGAWFVTTQTLTAAVVGVAVFTVAIVAGQTLGGLAFDVLGVGPGGRRPVTATRVVGALLALAAIGWAMSVQVAHAIDLWLVVLPFSAGLVVAWQQAVNGRVKAAAGSALTSTVVNFAVGTAALVAVLVVHAAVVGLPASMPAEPWLYVGGALGCLFIAAQAFVVRTIGVLVLALAGVAGQLAAALVLDLVLPTGSGAVEFATVGGALLAFAAVAVASMPPRGRRPRSARRRTEPAGTGHPSRPGEPAAVDDAAR